MVNILPKDAQNKLRTRYYLQLLSMVFFLVAVAFAAGAGLLAPSYLLARQEADGAKQYSTALQQTLALKQAAGAGAEMLTLAEELKLMKTYQADPAIAGAVSALTAKLPKGVSITKVLIIPPGVSDGKIGIEGRSKTRTELLAFVNDLQANASFKNVAVPVSDLAGDTDLPFSLTFSLVKQK